MKNTQSKNNTYTSSFRRSKTSACILTALGLLVPNIALSQVQSADEQEESTEVIEVTGLRSSMISAQAVKQNSNKIMDGISADDLGALPDRSITETLQRVAGVSIDRYMSLGDPEHFSVEGNGVIVRGLSQVRSELNGRSSFSANGGRTLSFGDVPPELLNAVNIYKSPTADQIEGGLAGTIDLETKLPFHNDGQKMSFSLEANYGDMIEETTPAYSALYSNTWDTKAGKFGFLADIAFSELATRNDSIYVRPYFSRNDMPGHEGDKVFVPRGADWRTMHFNRERAGQYVALQWAPSDNHEFVMTYFNSEYDMRWDEDAIFVSNDITQIVASADSVYDNRGVMQKGRLSEANGIAMGSDIRVSTQNAQTKDVSLEYKFTNHNSNFKLSLQQVKASSTGIDSTVAVATRVPYIDIDLSGSLPSVTSDANHLANPDNYVWDFLMDNQYDNAGDMTTAAADYEYFLEDSVITSVKTGARFTKSTSDNFDSGYNWGAVGNWLYGAGLIESGANPLESDMHLNEFNNFFHGDVASPANLYAPDAYYAEGFQNGSYQEVKDKVTYVDNGWFDPAGNTWQPRNLDDEQWYNAQEENTSAAYVQANFELPDLTYPVSGNFGVRYVKTENTAFGYLTFPNGELFGNNSYEERAAEHSYDNWLPSLNVKVELREDLYLRLAAAKAMTRPAFSSLRSSLALSAEIPEENRDNFIDPETNEVIQVPTANDFEKTGNSDYNPYLDPMTSTQFDASLEWYYTDSSSMYLALFTKDIDGDLVDEFVTESYAAEGYPQQEYLISRPVSEGKAKIKGAEISVNHFFTTLPSPFDGLGISANYTYIDSESIVNDDSAPLDTNGQPYDYELPFKAISKNAYNLVGIYQKYGVTVRLAYNWRSEFLTSVGANGFNGSIPLSGGFVDGSGENVDWRLPVLNAAAGYLDGSISYKLNDTFTVSLNANNLSNTVTKNIVKQTESGDHYSAYHMNDTRYSLALTANF
ncbi:TonB-dependent receptor [Paraglaciecola aquimarina]|uniref:TonB-dependent receptor n=1 Tax=Paraglaciecola algarum TaxID=3050085 RepID=A0ABS9DB08_9ALTE|nr:TonB-dependent receptor [Paraglaciecola sp. G1-23]MCF2949560.1 TonB-dependent receptor [Paraglaciecola sp. G1-23]